MPSNRANEAAAPHSLLLHYLAIGYACLMTSTMH